MLKICIVPLCCSSKRTVVQSLVYKLQPSAHASNASPAIVEEVTNYRVAQKSKPDYCCNNVVFDLPTNCYVRT